MNTYLKTLGILVVLSFVGACPDDPYCRQCVGNFLDPDTACLNCEQSLLDQQTGLCNPNLIKKVENCVSYREEANIPVCDQCELGYHLDVISKSCQKCGIAECAVCMKSPNVCNACFGGQILDTETNICQKDTKCSIPNCDICQFLTKDNCSCYKCKQGFAIDPSQAQCVASVQNCSVVSALDPSVCGACTFGYYINRLGNCAPLLQPHSRVFWLLLLALLILAGAGVYSYYVVFKHAPKQPLFDSHRVNENFIN